MGEQGTVRKESSSGAIAQARDHVFIPLNEFDCLPQVSGPGTDGETGKARRLGAGQMKPKEAGFGHVHSQSHVGKQG